MRPVAGRCGAGSHRESDVSCAVAAVVKRGELLTPSKFQLSLCIILFYLERNGVTAEGQTLNVRANVYKRDCLHNVEFPSKGKSDFPCVAFVCLAPLGSGCVYVCRCHPFCVELPLCDLFHLPQRWCFCACPTAAGQNVGLLHVSASKCPLERCAFYFT